MYPLDIDNIDSIPEIGKVNLECGMREKRFLEWLLENGAVLDKLEWPSRNTVSGVRGAIALCDIPADSPMFEIPLCCMIYPKICFQCEDLALIYSENMTFFEADDDITIALYLMHEKLQGSSSFWAPYIDMLPRPCGIADWTDEELSELQDATLVGHARRRDYELKRVYKSLVSILEKYALPNYDDYSFGLFVWAWLVIQSRAFGRHLPWTALVPFADCLNHINVQTKYDLFDQEIQMKIPSTTDIFQVYEQVDVKNYVFRLYPTGQNAYFKGQEAFNSYGRRSNRFLLKEYGFCLEDNEWDSVDVFYRVESTFAPSDLQRQVLSKVGMPSMKSFRMNMTGVNLELFAFIRFSCMTSDDLENLLCNLGEQDVILPWMQPVTYETEGMVLDRALTLFEKYLERYPTTLEDDQAILETPGIAFRLQCAVVYRMGMKKILHFQIQRIENIKSMLSRLAIDESPLNLRIYSKKSSSSSSIDDD